MEERPRGGGWRPPAAGPMGALFLDQQPFGWSHLDLPAGITQIESHLVTHNLVRNNRCFKRCKAGGDLLHSRRTAKGPGRTLMRACSCDWSVSYCEVETFGLLGPVALLEEHLAENIIHAFFQSVSNSW